MLCPINSWCRSNHRSNCFTPLHFTALINTETGDAKTALTTFRFCCRLGRANPLRDWWLPAAAAIGNRVTPLRQRTPGHLAPTVAKWSEAICSKHSVCYGNARGHIWNRTPGRFTGVTSADGSASCFSQLTPRRRSGVMTSFPADDVQISTRGASSVSLKERNRAHVSESSPGIVCHVKQLGLELWRCQKDD